MKKLLLLVPGLVLMALLLAPVASNAVEPPANDNHTNLTQIDPIIEANALAWHGNKGHNPKEPPYGPPGWADPPGWIPGPPGWSGPKGVSDGSGQLQQQTATAGWNRNNCPHGPPCGPPGWSGPKSK